MWFRCNCPIVEAEVQSSRRVLSPTCVVDTGAHTVTALIGHFTIFAVIGTEEVAFDFANLSISPGLVNRGDSVTITVEVTNTGGLEGSCTMPLFIYGVEETGHELTLGPGASDIVTLP